MRLVCVKIMLQCTEVCKKSNKWGSLLANVFCVTDAMTFLTHTVSLQHNLSNPRHHPYIGAVCSNSVSLTLQINTLRRPWTVSQHQEMIWDPLEQETNLTLSHTFSPHFPHISSCLGSYMLTAAQITGPQTWWSLHWGGGWGVHLGQKLVGLMGCLGRKEVEPFLFIESSQLFSPFTIKLVVWSQFPLQHRASTRYEGLIAPSLYGLYFNWNSTAC